MKKIVKSLLGMINPLRRHQKDLTLRDLKWDSRPLKEVLVWRKVEEVLNRKEVDHESLGSNRISIK